MLGDASAETYLEAALNGLRTERTVVVMHYSPIAATVMGEPPETFRRRLDYRRALLTRPSERRLRYSRGVLERIKRERLAGNAVR